MKQLWLKIGVSFVVLFFVTMGIVGLLSGELMKTTYLNMKKNQLQDEAQILLKTTKLTKLDLDSQSKTVEQQLEPLKSDIGARITIINKKGKVIADTQDDPMKMENHLGRPEIHDVLKQQKTVSSAVRKSQSVGYSMLYVAVPLKNQNGMEGALRISVSLKSIEVATKHLWSGLFVIFGLALIVIAAISIFLARKITQPIKEIITVSNDLAEDKYDSRIHGTSSGELQDLSLSVNKLAESLEIQMYEIKENAERLRAIVENLVSGVMLINADKQVVMTNKMIHTILSEKNMVGKAFYEVIKSYDLDQLFEKALKTKKIQQEEVTLYFPHEAILDASVSPIINEKGEISDMVLLLHDVTQIRHLENVRSEFVANVSHELKTPVTALKGFVETLLDGAMYDEELLKQFLTIIKDESDRLHRLIIDILALSRIEQKKVVIKQEEMIDLKELVNQSLKTIQKFADEKAIQLRIKSDNEQVMLLSNRDALQQILLNLLSNGIAYTPGNGEIIIGISNLSNHVKLTITDNGIGIPANDLEHIFERFYRVDKARSRHSGGTGLGLSIVKHLVETMQGSINVTSVEGKGTTFSIQFPK
ncbi:two-component system histidine kinase PnpS [Listeria sp. PSOL-1]|uniref:two-component system histidine kinase PnpS n=1 Tax=Listeria sp. PSOL-1 TaxID=1844999 RepID=UPI0013D1E783|nr:ATP-binding protein [Listeria sp. PSOL-1]